MIGPSVLLYHWSSPAKYRRTVLDAEVEAALREVWLGIEERYHMKFW